ncbi:Protein FATTY ACID EXPORT 3 chloroplastic [Bienertia sinuspersici]
MFLSSTLTYLFTSSTHLPPLSLSFPFPISQPSKHQIMTPECLSIANPNPNSVVLPLNNNINNNLSSSSMVSFSLCLPSSLFSLQSKSIHLHRRTVSVAGMVSGLSLPSRNWQKKNFSVVSFAASHEESSSEGEIDMEKKDHDKAGKESQEAWEQALASFKEQALKVQSVSQEAYDVYMKKAVVTLKDTAEQLKIQAEQARQDLSVMTKELSEDGRQYLATAAENSPEPVKDVVETFASARDLDDVSKVRDFYIGIPYGAVLSAGGFLNFMLTGSLSAIRFGVILGGILLALSVSSLRSWRKGEFNDTTLKGQAAITTILFLRDTRLVFEGLTFAGVFRMIFSGAVAAFFLYRITYDKQQSRPNLDGEATG